MLFFKVLCIFAAVVAILYLIMIMPRMMHRPDREKFTKVLYAHRGLHDNNTDAPENSMAAFRKAVEGGYGIECDVQLTRDGIPVIFHDFTLKRVARYENDKEAEVKGKVIDYTYDELQELVLLGSKERIPKFEDFLKMVDGRVPLIIELKIELKDLRVCGEAWKFLKGYKGVYCIESFNPLGVWWFKHNHPDIMRGQLSDEFHKDSPEEFKGILYFILTGLLFNFLTKPDFIAFNRKYPKSVSMQLCRKLYKCTCAAWTVKSQEQLLEARKDFDIFIFDSFIPENGSRSFF